MIQNHRSVAIDHTARAFREHQDRIKVLRETDATFDQLCCDFNEVAESLELSPEENSMKRELRRLRTDLAEEIAEVLDR